VFVQVRAMTSAIDAVGATASGAAWSVNGQWADCLMTGSPRR
jgi:hypothetical protein